MSIKIFCFIVLSGVGIVLLSILLTIAMFIDRLIKILEERDDENEK